MKARLTEMRPVLALLAILSAVHAASWSFTSAKLDISGTPYPFSPTSGIVSVSLGPEDKFKLLLTTTNGEEAKKPHQAMLLLKESHSDLEANLVIPVKSNGRGAITIATKDLGPVLVQGKSIDLTLVLGGFGEDIPMMKHIATIQLENLAETSSTSVLRYGALPEIFHTFRPPQEMPPKIISFAFTLVLLAGLVGLIGLWGVIGVNLDALSSAFSNAPLAYSTLLVSLFAIEAVLVIYWTHWRIMKAIGTLVLLSIPVFFSARYAMIETAKRRKAGSR